MISKKMKEKFGPRITLTNNEIKDVMKVINSLENRLILSKGATIIDRPLIIADLPLMKSVTAEMSATDTSTQRKSWITNYSINNFTGKCFIMKMFKYVKESGLLIKGISKTIKNGSKEQKGRFLQMLLATLDASVLENALPGKGIIRPGENF